MAGFYILTTHIVERKMARCACVFFFFFFTVSAFCTQTFFLIDPFDLAALLTARLSIWLCVSQQRL